MEPLTRREILRQVTLQTVGVALVCVGIRFLPYGAHCSQYRNLCLEADKLLNLSGVHLGLGGLFLVGSVWPRSLRRRD